MHFVAVVFPVSELLTIADRQIKFWTRLGEYGVRTLAFPWPDALRPERSPKYFLHSNRAGIDPRDGRRNSFDKPAFRRRQFHPGAPRNFSREICDVSDRQRDPVPIDVSDAVLPI